MTTRTMTTEAALARPLTPMKLEHARLVVGPQAFAVLDKTFKGFVASYLTGSAHRYVIGARPDPIKLDPDTADQWCIESDRSG